MPWQLTLARNSGITTGIISLSPPVNIRLHDHQSLSNPRLGVTTIDPPRTHHPPLQNPHVLFHLQLRLQLCSPHHRQKYVRSHGIVQTAPIVVFDALRLFRSHCDQDTQYPLRSPSQALTLSNAPTYSPQRCLTPRTTKLRSGVSHRGPAQGKGASSTKAASYHRSLR